MVSQGAPSTINIEINYRIKHGLAHKYSIDIEILTNHWFALLKIGHLLSLMAFEILRNSNFVNVCSYLTGTPEEGEQISTDRQQDQHAIEIQAGRRGSGQGQCWLKEAEEGVGWYLWAHNTSSIPPRFRTIMRPTHERSSYLERNVYL